MQAAERLSLEQIRAFLEGTDEIGFKFKGRNRSIVGVRLGEPNPAGAALPRVEAGQPGVRRYLEKFTGLSRAQMTRLITIYLGKGR